VPVRDTQADRQTNSAENKCPSGLQSGQYVIQAQRASKDIYRLTTCISIAHKYYASTVYSAMFLTTTTTFIAHTFCASKPFCCFHSLPLEVLYAQILRAEQVAPPCDSDIYITHQHLLCDAAIGEQEITMNHPIKVSAVQRHKNHLSGPLNLLPMAGYKCCACCY